MTPMQVEQFLQHLNDAWLTQDYVGLGRLYHPNVVLLPPDAGDPIEGDAAVIDSYRDFHAACKVERFAVTQQTSWEFAATTVVHMRFDIDYQVQTAAPPQAEQGLEVYTLISPQALEKQENVQEAAALQEHPAAQIVWRAQFAL